RPRSADDAQDHRSTRRPHRGPERSRPRHQVHHPPARCAIRRTAGVSRLVAIAIALAKKLLSLRSLRLGVRLFLTCPRRRKNPQIQTWFKRWPDLADLPDKESCKAQRGNHGHGAGSAETGLVVDGQASGERDARPASATAAARARP